MIRSPRQRLSSRRLAIGLLIGMAVGCDRCDECEDGEDCGYHEYCFIERDNRSECLPEPDGWDGCDHWGDGARRCKDGSKGERGCVSRTLPVPDQWEPGPHDDGIYYTIDCS